MNTLSVIWIYVFQFLNLNDLARAAGTCFEWWSTIKRCRLMEGREWEDLDLSASSTLYRFIPRRVFRHLTSLNLASTQVTDRHFLQMMRSSTTLEVLDILFCTGISHVAIFQATISDKIVDTFTLLTPYFITVIHFCSLSLSFRPPSPPNNVEWQFL